MKISIVIPNYNQGIFSKECFDSILKQDLTPNEVIVVDDASTDNSLDLINKQMEKAKTKNLSIVWKLSKHLENKKLPAARNTGVRVSSGELIICLDMDDMLAPNYISTCIHTIRKYNCDIAYCDSMMFGIREGVVSMPEYHKNILRTRNFINCSAMFKREVWDKSNYDESFVDGFEDYEFWVSAVQNGFTPHKNTKSVLLYRQKQESMLQGMTVEKLAKNKVRFEHKHKGFIFW